MHFLIRMRTLARLAVARCLAVVQRATVRTAGGGHPQRGEDIRAAATRAEAAVPIVVQGQTQRVDADAHSAERNMHKKTEVGRTIIGRAHKELPGKPVEAGDLEAGAPDERVRRPTLARKNRR